MTDQLKRIRAQQAAKDYMLGAKLRAQAEQLSDKSLAGKFGCNEWTIKRVKHALPTGVLDDDDQSLVRQCASEKTSLDKKVRTLTKAALCYSYKVSHEAIDLELELMGYEKPKRKRAVA